MHRLATRDLLSNFFQLTKASRLQADNIRTLTYISGNQPTNYDTKHLTIGSFRNKNASGLNRKTVLSVQG